jgi:hypothetical protein
MAFLRDPPKSIERRAGQCPAGHILGDVGLHCDAANHLRQRFGFVAAMRIVDRAAHPTAGEPPDHCRADPGCAPGDDRHRIRHRVAHRMSPFFEHRLWH